MRRSAPWILVLLLALIPARAGAQSSALTIAIDGFPDWSTAVSMLEHDRFANGRQLVVHVVRDTGTNATCGTYTLALDAIGARAFQIESCDAANGATTVRLVDRTALFAPGVVVPVPLHPTLTATYRESAAVTGGAESNADAEVNCHLALRPFMENIEDGSRVYLTPDRFALRVLDARVTAVPAGDGWVLDAPRGTSLAVEYDIVDRTSGQVVTHRTATMACESAPVPAPDVTLPAPPPAPPPAPAPALPTPQREGTSVSAPHFTTTLSADFTFASTAYLVTDTLVFHVGANTISGADAGLTGALMFGSGPVGMTVSSHHVFATIAPRVYFGDHLTVWDAQVVAGLSVEAGGAVVRLGPEVSLWTASLYLPGGAGATDFQTGLGAWTQVLWRSRRHKHDRSLGFVESGMALTVPIFGEGCWALAWTESWGRGW